MKLFKNKILLAFVTFCVAGQCVLPLAEAHTTASPMLADFLCEKGVYYYQQGQYPKALQEFKKALLANPESSLAREYMGRIEKGKSKDKKDSSGFSAQRTSSAPVGSPAVVKPGSKNFEYDEALKQFETQQVLQPTRSTRAKDVPQLISEGSVAKCAISCHSERSPKGEGKNLDGDEILRSAVGLPQNDKRIISQQSHDVQKKVLSGKQQCSFEPKRSTDTSGQQVVVFKEGILLENQVDSRKPSSVSGEMQKGGQGQSGAPSPFVSAAKETVIDLQGQGGKAGDSFDIQACVGARFLIKGADISRFVVTEPKFLKVSRKSGSEFLAEALDHGVSHIHIWDKSGRKTLKFNIEPRQHDIELKETQREEMKKEDTYVPQSFKMNYSIEGSSFMTGRGFGDLHRTSYSWSYRWGLRGETPFGSFDSAIQGSRTFQKTYKISNLRLALTDAHYQQFKNITIRCFDFTPTFASLGFPTSDLRGIMVKAPMFDKRLDYMAFWGALPQGGFTSLSTNSGLSPTKKAWLEGVGINYKVSKAANLKTFYAHSYGPERSEPVLTSDAAGATLNYNIGKVRMGSSVISDMRYLSYRANCNLSLSKFFAGLSMMDTNKNFRSLLGGNPASGSTSGTLTLSFQPMPSILISNTFSGYRDKVFGNLERPNRPNYNSVTEVTWSMDRHTDFQLSYIMDDQMGSNAPSVYETKNVTFRKKFFFFKKFNSFITYSNNKNKNYSSSAQDYNNNRVLLGLNCQLIENLYFYYNKELNFLYNKFSQERAFPTAQETGLQYNRQIFDWPLYANLRLFYRDEQDTESVLSYLSGQDRFETDGEIIFKPNKDSELFMRCRVANIWAEKEGVDKHFDLSLNWGLRFLWDTGLRWETVGNFDGYVFYDLNGDGVMQPGEKGVAGVVIIGPAKKQAKTNEKGYYKLLHIKGQTVYLELDVKTLPQKYNPTTSVMPKCDIIYGKTGRVNFGIATRSGAEGIVFEDRNKNGRYDAGEQLVQGIIVILDNKEKVVSNLMGAYRFRNLSPGAHTISIDLKSIPVEFVPKVPISKKISLEEGTTFSYPIPLEKTK